MGNPMLLFPARVTPSQVAYKTNQGGPMSLLIVPDAVNVGALQLGAIGTTTAAVNERVEVVDAGNLNSATFKFYDGTEWKGRDHDWSDAEGGGADSFLTVFASTDSAANRPRRIVTVDRDGDGVPDRALTAICDPSGDIVIRYTDTLLRDGSTAQTWATLATIDIPSVTFENHAVLCWWKGALWLAAQVNYIGTDDEIRIMRSDDFGETWTTVKQIGISNLAYQDPIDMVVSPSGARLLLQYAITGVTLKLISSTDGVTWTATAKTLATGAGLAGGGLVTFRSGKVMCLYVNGTTITALECMNANPAHSAATWSSHTLWTTPTGGWPSGAAVGDALFISYDSSGMKCRYAPDAGTNSAPTYSAAETVATLADSYGALSFILGSLWLLTLEATVDDVRVFFSRYWADYVAGEEQLVTDDPWLGPDGLLYTWGGGQGETGDGFTILSSFLNDIFRAFGGNPNVPALAADDEAWKVALNMGTNLRLPADAIAVACNAETATWKMDNDYSGSGVLPSPSTSATVSFVAQTITGYSVGDGGVLTKTGAAWPIRGRVGWHIKTSDGTFLVVDNDEEHIYVDGDISAVTGDVLLLAPKKWIQFTADRKQYAALEIAALATPEGRWEIPTIAAGRMFDLGQFCSRVQTGIGSVMVEDGLDGEPLILDSGPPRSAWTIYITGPTEEQRDRLEAELTAARFGGIPFIFVPNSDDSNYFAVCTLERLQVDWQFNEIALTVREV